MIRTTFALQPSKALQRSQKPLFRAEDSKYNRKYTILFDFGSYENSKSGLEEASKQLKQSLQATERIDLKSINSNKVGQTLSFIGTEGLEPELRRVFPNNKEIQIAPHPPEVTIPWKPIAQT